MIKVLLFLGTGLCILDMSTDDSVKDCYEEQRNLEQEEQEKLLAREPGETDAEEGVRPEILDVSMEEPEENTEQAPPLPPPTPPPAAPPATPAPKRDVSQSRSSNSNRSDMSNNPNPSEGGSNITNPTTSEANPNMGANSVSNKVKLYTAAKNGSAVAFLPNLFGGGSRVMPDYGSFLIEGDTRFENTYVRSDISTGTNITYSFDPDSLSCSCCGHGGGGGGSGGGGGRTNTWVFSDQNFSPILPSTGAGKCLKIVRMENSDIGSNIGKFLALHGNAIKPGDTILVSSASQLGREGFAGYVRSYQEAVKLLKLGNRRTCNILPAPFILLGGCTDPNLGRLILEFQAWIRISGVDPDGVLNDAFAVVEHHIRSSPGKKQGKLPDVTHKIPMNISSPKETCVFSEGPTNLPEGVGAFMESTEKLVVTSLLRNLKEMLKLDLDCDPTFSRVQANSTKECFKYIVIGDAHASMVSAELNNSGTSSIHVPMQHYRASNVHAGKLKTSLAELEVTPDTVLVLQLFDNALFMTETEEGGLLPLSKDIGGNFHCFGDLVPAPKEMQWKLFSQVAEDISHLKNNKTVILAPLPKYLEVGCCDKEDHMPNRSQAGYRKKMEDAVYQSRTNLKDFAFRSGLRRAKTLSTWGLVKKKGVAWQDAIMLEPQLYKTIAEAVVAAAVDVGTKRPGEAPTTAPQPKRGRGQDGYITPQPRGGAQPGRGGVRGWNQRQRPPLTQMGGRGGGRLSGDIGWSRGQHRGRRSTFARYN
jgi:hypothetical protein